MVSFLNIKQNELDLTLANHKCTPSHNAYILNPLKKIFFLLYLMCLLFKKNLSVFPDRENSSLHVWSEMSQFCRHYLALVPFFSKKFIFMYIWACDSPFGFFLYSSCSWYENWKYGRKRPMDSTMNLYVFKTSHIITSYFNIWHAYLHIHIYSNCRKEKWIV